MHKHQQIQQSKKPDTIFQKQSTSASQTPVSNPYSIIQRARTNPRSLTHADIMQLQRTIGNQAVGRLLTGIGNTSTAQQATVQRQEIPEEEEPLQGKIAETIQRQEIPEEEEPLQGKFTGTVQRQEIPEEEQPLQGKMVGTVQRQEIPEEEEPLQGKFENKPEIACASCFAAPIMQRQEIPEEEEPLQTKRENNTGMPDNLKAGVESLSGIDMSDVRVQYNSSKPAEVGALAYTQGMDIHVAPGQEQHLPHETWHVVQQKQDRVKPTVQLKDGDLVNDDEGLEREADEMGGRVVDEGHCNLVNGTLNFFPLHNTSRKWNTENPGSNTVPVVNKLITQQQLVASPIKQCHREGEPSPEDPVVVAGEGENPLELDHQSRALYHELAGKMWHFLRLTRNESKEQLTARPIDDEWVKTTLRSLKSWKEFHCHRSQIDFLINYLNVTNRTINENLWNPLVKVGYKWEKAIDAIEALNHNNQGVLAYTSKIKNFDFNGGKTPKKLMPSTVGATSGAFWNPDNDTIFVSRGLTDPIEILEAILFECGNAKRQTQYAAVPLNDRDRGKKIALVEFETDKANQVDLRSLYNVSTQRELCLRLGVPEDLLSQSKQYKEKTSLKLPDRRILRGQSARNALWWFWVSSWTEPQQKEIWMATNHGETMGATEEHYA